MDKTSILGRGQGDRPENGCREETGKTMRLLEDLSQHWQLEDPEERRTISNVTWAQYEGLLAQLGDSLAYRVNYLDGVLEIVAPSRRHETGKTRISDLLLIRSLA
jgi:hypothetical protein